MYTQIQLMAHYNTFIVQKSTHRSIRAHTPKRIEWVCSAEGISSQCRQQAFICVALSTRTIIVSLFDIFSVYRKRRINVRYFRISRNAYTVSLKTLSLSLYHSGYEKYGRNENAYTKFTMQ